MEVEDNTPETGVKRRPVVLYIATRDGLDCGIQHADELGLGKKLCLRRGLLVPHEKPKLFRSFTEMNRMMTHTQSAYKTLKGSMVDQHPRLKALLGVTSAFGFRRVIRKGGKLVPLKEANPKVTDFSPEAGDI